MNKIIIWHNENCSKSRAALTFLKEKNLNLKVVNYLEDIPSKDDVKDVLSFLNFKSYKEMTRVTEELYSDLKLQEVSSEELLLDALVKNPSLIQRPIIINNQKAVIARPLENINKII